MPLDDKDIQLDSNSLNPSVRLLHLPTGLSVVGSLFPTQTMNKCYAMGVLSERVEDDLRLAAAEVLKAWTSSDNEIALQRAMDGLKAALGDSTK